MTTFDWIIIAIFVISIIVGIMRGFMREALSIMSWVIAGWLGVTFCSEAGDYIAQYISLPAEYFRIAAGFGAIFIITLFIFSLLSYVITKLFVQGPIKGTDRALGVIFGVVRGAAIIAVVIVLSRGLGMSSSDWWQKSQLVGHIEPVADYIEAILPEQLQGFSAANKDADDADSTNTEPSTIVEPVKDDTSSIYQKQATFEQLIELANMKQTNKAQ